MIFYHRKTLRATGLVLGGRVKQAYKEAKKQADEVYKEIKKIAVNKQSKEEAAKAHKEAIGQAKKLRDSIMAEAMAVFRTSYDKADADYLETQAKSQAAVKGQMRPTKRPKSRLT